MAQFALQKPMEQMCWLVPFNDPIGRDAVDSMAGWREHAVVLAHHPAFVSRAQNNS